jgi:hypothetical protein
LKTGVKKTDKLLTKTKAAELHIGTWQHKEDIFFGKQE